MLNQAHRHNGIDNLRVNFSDLDGKKIYVNHTIYGADAATAGNYGVFWTAPMKCVVTGFKEVHAVAGTNGGAVTLQLEKLTGTQALDAGTTVLSTALDLKATANTVQTGVMTVILANRQLAAGDRLALKDSGTLTSLDNINIVVEITH